MSNMYGRQVILPLTNKSGGGVIAGDVVIIDTTNDDAFTTTTSGQSQKSVGVAQETIANNATGRVLVAGEAALINVPSSVTRGHYIETHTVAKQATGNSSRRAGSFGQFKTGGTTPKGWLWGFPDNSGAAGSTVGTDTIWDAKGDLAGGTGADTAAKLTVGSNGKLLVADSSQATGLAWIAVPVSGSVVGDGSADVTTTSTTFVDLTAASITITTLARHVTLGFNCTTLNSGADNLNSFQFLIDAAALTGTGSLGDIRSQEHTATVAHAVSLSMRSPSALSAASHTFKVQWRVSAGTGTIKNLSASVVWSFWVAELWD